jgi:2-C-methyl-D-erythritol 4-phosphate cytidylyltransferase
MNIGVILAGGSGTRMGSEIPKQFIDIYGKPLIIHTLESFDANPNIDYILVVCKEDWHDNLKIWIRKFGINKVKWIINGGETRQDSTYNALNTLKKECSGDDILVIHDSARPLISQRIIDDNIDAAKEFNAVDTVIPATDTIVKSFEGEVIDEVPVRKYLYMGQTPQSFKYDFIVKAHENAKINSRNDSTDDCQLVLDLNEHVHFVNGDKLNFKVTTFEDLLMLKSLIKLGKLEVL